MRTISLSIAAFVAVGGAACTSESPPAAVPALEIAGSWTSPFGAETITNQSWAFSFGTSAIVLYDNAKNTAFLQAPKDDKYNPSKFSKVVWTEPKADAFHYCTIDLGKDSLALAQASTLVADDKSPDSAGCAGFAWTKLTRKK